MSKKRGLSLSQVLQADLSGLIWNWVKGIWSSFSRFLGRSLRPNQGRRPSPSGSQYAEPAHICSLVGVTQFRHAESLTVGDLMAKVKWRVSIPTVKATTPATATSASVASVKDEINWD